MVTYQIKGPRISKDLAEYVTMFIRNPSSLESGNHSHFGIQFKDDKSPGRQKEDEMVRAANQKRALQNRRADTQHTLLTNVTYHRLQPGGGGTSLADGRGSAAQILRKVPSSNYRNLW